MTPWSELPLKEAAGHLRDGNITAEAYAETLLAVCEAGASLNAFISLNRDGVLSAARAADRTRHLHELAFGITSSNEFTGAIRNPYDPTISPGGSRGVIRKP